MLLALLLSVSATRPAVSAARLSVSAASPAVPKAVLALRGGFNPITALPRAYGSALASSPMATNIVTAAGLAVAADAVAQKLTAGEDWDWARTFWMVPWGALVSGYAMVKWFTFLGGLFPDAATSAIELVKKVFVNQMVLSPGINAGFFAFVILTQVPPVARMSGANWSELKAKLKKDLWPTFMQGNLYWSCVQTLNFKVLPASLTVLSTNVAFLIWTAYLCIVANRAE